MVAFFWGGTLFGSTYKVLISVLGVLRSPSDAPWPVDVDSRPEIAVRVEKVGFKGETLSL